MATPPAGEQDHIALAVEAERQREEVALQFSKKAQYYAKMKLKDEEVGTGLAFDCVPFIFVCVGGGGGVGSDWFVPTCNARARCMCALGYV
jgi:hypothetical protein